MHGSHLVYYELHEIKLQQKLKGNSDLPAALSNLPFLTIKEKKISYLDIIQLIIFFLRKTMLFQWFKKTKQSRHFHI